MNKKTLWFSIVLVVLIIVAVLFQNRIQNDSVRIGALMPLTGGLASYGEPAQKMADIALADINAAGGINGKKMEIVYEDHKCDPKTMVSAYKKLLGEKIRIFSSIACTGTVAGISTNLVSDDALVLGTVTSGVKLTGISPNFFRNWASDGQEAKLLSDRVLKMGYRNIAVIYEETDYAKGLKLAMEENLKNTGIKITSESFVSGATDVRSQLTKLSSINPDLVFVSVQTVPSGEMVLTQMEQLKFMPTMFINDNILKAAALVKGHAALLEGAIGGDYVFKDTEKLNAVLAKYKEKYGVDCPQKNICAAEYDAVQLLAEAIKANGNTASGVKDYLSKAKYSGVSGDISFDAKNDRSNSQYSLFVIRSGQATLLGK